MGTEIEDPRAFSEEMSSDLKALGFEAGWPIIEMVGSDQDFSIEDLFAALRCAHYWKPSSVVMRYDVGEREPVVALGVVPEAIQAVFEPLSMSPDARPIGCWENPSWYVKGRLLHGGNSPDSHADRVHIWLSHNHEDGKLPGEFLFQLVREDLPDIDPDAPLMWLPHGAAPGQY